MAEQHPPKRRVLILVKGLGIGGVERLLSESIPFLDRQRFDYEVCYLTPWKDDLAPAFESAGIPVHCLDIVNDLSPGAIRRIRSLLVNGRYDLVHSHSPQPSIVARMVGRRAGVSAIIHTEHSLPGSRHPLTRVANRLTYRRCDLVISVSKDVGDAVIGMPYLRPSATEVIHGGVNVDRIRSSVDPADRSVLDDLGVPREHRVVGNVAHLRRQKGHELWLEVAARVIEAEPNTTFVVAGREKEEGYLATLAEKAADLGIAGNVHFVGYVPSPYQLMSAFDVFLMTSEYEGFPIALIEAMALGRAVVAPDVGGISEAFENGVSGVLSPRRDAEVISADVVRLIRDDELRHRLGETARDRVERTFSLSEMVRRVETLYDGLLDERRSV